MQGKVVVITGSLGTIGYETYKLFKNYGAEVVLLDIDNKKVNKIKNSIDNNKKCLNEGFTQPKIMTNGVIAQIDGILNVSIEDNPYYKVFSNIDNESLQNSAKELITNKINPAYKALNDFLKNEYLPNSRDSIGIKDVPNGSKYYEELAIYISYDNYFFSSYNKKFEPSC